MANDLVEAFKAAIWQRAVEAEREPNCTIDESMEKIARAILPIAAEHFAGVAEAMQNEVLGTAVYKAGFCTGCVSVAEAIRASVEPTP